MVPPRWPDEQGRPIPTDPCPRCGLEVASRFKDFRVENLKHVGRQLFRIETYVNGCGHEQEVSPLLLAYGRMAFVPVLGEARWPQSMSASKSSKRSGHITSAIHRPCWTGVMLSTSLRPSGSV
jgi:hypothetical protein